MEGRSAKGLTMQLTMTGEYAVRAMMHMSSLPFKTTAQIADISRQWDIPENFLRKIVAQLSKSGLLTSQRGSGGGITLAQPAETTTLLDVIEAVEGKMFLNKCLMGPDACSRSGRCAVHIVWCEAQQKLREVLGKWSLAELAEHDRQLSLTRQAAGANP